MKSNYSIYTLIVLSTMIFGALAGVNAEDNESEGYRLPLNTDKRVNVHSECKVARSTSMGRDVFVPTRSTAEWSAFKSSAGPLGIAVNDCPVDPPPPIDGGGGGGGGCGGGGGGCGGAGCQ